MKPLDPYIEIAALQFPKYITIEESNYQSFKLDSVLLREKNQNNYCYMETKGTTGKILVSFFKCDSSNYNEIEESYLYNGISFQICSKAMAEVIFDCLL